jgi:uncharacterized protein
MAKFEIKQSDKGTFYYRLKATGNHEIILTKNRYETKADCIADIYSVKSYATDDTLYSRRTSTDGQFYFHITNLTNDITGVSELYRTRASRDHGIELIKAQAPGAAVEDLT